MAKFALWLAVLLHINLCFITLGIEIGSAAQRRSILDSEQTFLIVPDVNDGSTVNGRVTGFQIHTWNTRQVQLGIWRHVSGEDYRLVGKVDITPTNAGVNNINLTPAEYIPVETGDVLGIKWSSGAVIDFDTVSCNHNTNARLKWGPPSLITDDVYTFVRTSASTWGACRQYSAKAIIEEQLEDCPEDTYSATGTYPNCVNCTAGSIAPPGSTSCTEQCVVTQRTIKRYDDLYRGSTIFVDYPFQCAGPVSGLQFYAERAGTFYLSAWRPNNSGDSWTLLGYIAITSERQGDQTYVIPVGEQIDVEASDVLGIVYARGSPSLIASKKLRKKSSDASGTRFRQTRQTVDRLSIGDRQSALSTGKRIVPINAIIG